jgi:hypothetical protein
MEILDASATCRNVQPNPLRAARSRFPKVTRSRLRRALGSFGSAGAGFRADGARLILALLALVLLDTGRIVGMLALERMARFYLRRRLHPRVRGEKDGSPAVNLRKRDFVYPQKCP